MDWLIKNNFCILRFKFDLRAKDEQKMSKKSKILLLSLCFYTSLPTVLWVQKNTVSNAYLLIFFLWAVVGAWMFFQCWQYMLVKPNKNGLKFEELAQDFDEQKKQYRALSLRYSQLLSDYGEKSNTQRDLERKIEHLKEMQQNQQDEYLFLNQDLQSQLEKRERALSESRNILQEQRQVIEKKQSEINVLNLKVKNLEYEMEHLLQLDNSPEISNFEDSAFPSQATQVVLDRPMTVKDKLSYYAEMARTLTETNPFAQKRGGASSPFGSLLIDQRRLFDRLESEDTDAVLIYSFEERRILFVNRCIKQLLGWSPDQFNRDFSFLVQKGLDHWQESLDRLADNDIEEVRLLVKTQPGQNILTQCYLAKLSDGVFQNHAIGVLSSVAKR